MQNPTNALRRGLLSAAILVALSTSAQADGDDVAALQARVEQLERMVQELLVEREADRSAMKEMEARTEKAIEERVATVVEEIAPPEKSDSRHTYAFGGYVKTDFIASAYSAGDLAPASVGRDFYIPGTIPVGGSDESTDIDYHAKESRLFFKSDHLLDSGDKLGAYVEMDFLLSGQGNERVSNSYAARIRHAFLKYNGWLAGQTWTTFQNVGALPDNLDFVGPAEGTAFGRNPMIRYSSGPWQFALENPETTVTPFGGGGRIVSDDSNVPDFIARYEAKGDWGNVIVAGIARQLKYEDIATGIDDTVSGYGVSVSGKSLFGDDDLRWMVNYGSGLGRYVGLNTANGAVLDANGELEAIDSLSGFLSYRHFWAPKLRSNFTYSFMQVDNDTNLTGFGVTEDVYSFHANLIYSPLPKVDVGVEYLHANRELESGLDGDLDRLQVSFKYGF